VVDWRTQKAVLAERVAAGSRLATGKRVAVAAEGVDPRPGWALLAGDDGVRIFRTSASTAALAAQLANPVDCAAALEALVEAGAEKFLDLGPGHALADMTRAAFPGVRSYAADAFHSVDGLRDWIASA
jgi:hypothetical protein